MNNTKQEQEFEDFKTELRKIIQKAEPIVKEIGESIGQKAEKILGNMTGELNSSVNTIFQRTKEGGKKVDQYVKENPWLIALVALSIGFIAGLLMTSKKKE